MKELILSIICIVIISTIILIILPEGKTNRIIRNISQITIILVILTPITKVSIDSFINFDDDNLLETFYQDDFVEFVNESKILILKDQCEELLSECGIKGASCDFGFNLDGQNVIKIKFVLVNLSNSVIISQDEHIVVIEQAILKISSFFDLSAKEVFVYK